MGCGSSNHKALKPTVRSFDSSNSDSRSIVRTLNELPIAATTFIASKFKSLELDYNCISSIHTGSHSEIYLAHHIPTGQIRAVKIIPKRSDDKLGAQSRPREMEILRRLNHPNILKCYELLEDEKKYYMVTEYCEGGNLKDRLTNHTKLTEQEVAEVMLQVLSAVSYMHATRIVHRDIRPENILLLGSGTGFEVKIADLSKAAVCGAGARLSGNYGKGEYVAPEVLKGLYNEMVDEWSCGILMYYMLLGKSPYKNTAPDKLIQCILQGNIDLTQIPEGTISGDALYLMSYLLEVDPNKRISAKLAHTFSFILNKKRSYRIPELNCLMNNMRNFSSLNKLQDAIYTYIAVQYLSSQEAIAYKHAFKSLDTNNDGKITHDELLAFFTKSLGKDKALKEVKHIMKEVDCDLNQYIDYSEFLKASIDRNKLISKQNLDSVFSVFDSDHNGAISADELKEMLGREFEVEESVWEEMVKIVDINSDGKIDLQEFYSMLPDHRT